MTISRKLLLIGAFVATGMTQAVSMKGFDISQLNRYIAQSNTALVLTQQDLQDRYNYARPEKAFAKELYSLQKSALKIILKKLKHEAKYLKKHDKAAWLPARQLYKGFKHTVYKPWKATFKRNYTTSLADNNSFSWSWVYNQEVYFFLK